jgi:DNA-binding NtrC family response regulator
MGTHPNAADMLGPLLEPDSKARVVVVEDDRSLHPLIVETLSSEFEVRFFVHASQALTDLRTQSADVVCASFSAGGMSGLRLLAEAAGLDAGVTPILMTNYREYGKRNKAEGQATETTRLLILKPYETRQLLETVRSAADRSRIKREGIRAMRALQGNRS